MSFGSSGFGGFGQNNNNTTSTFGGFGSNNNTSSGFGSTTNNNNNSNNNAFGANPSSTGGGLFSNSGGGSGFGTSSGFGSSNAFGAKPSGFGTTTTTGGSMFGSTTATAGGSGFGGSGFGSTSTSSPFGGGTGSSLFGGGNKTSTFGATAPSSTPSGGLFGSNTGSGFGSTSGTSAFGAAGNPGIGTNVGDPPGTAVVAFSPTVEKEATSSQSSSYQNILFMDPYKKWSSEELRLTDYNQGRRFGNTGGTGAFGGSGFGSGTFGGGSTTAGFGASSTPSNTFGTSQPSGFGATTATTGSGFGSGGSFGAKPGGLFGSTQPAATGGGLFGQTNAGTSAFGGNNTTTPGFGAQNTTSGGLFGNTPKPGGFGGFGGGTTATATPFGAPAAGATSSFGGTSTTGGGLFGNTTQNNTTATPFGSTTTQQPASTSFGGAGFGAQTQNAGGGLFGNTQQKPGGLFGASTTTTSGGGLFGNTGSTTTPFGGNTTQTASTGGGLFGPKPAATGTGLFGQPPANTTTATTGGGLFGGLGNTAQQQQPAQGGGLFGGLGQSQAKPSLFGTSQPAAGGGLFGQTPQQPGGLFGGSQQQQAQPAGLGSSLFNNSQNAQSINSNLSTSLIDPNAYGSHTLFSMADNKAQDPGPLATPLSGTAKTKSRSILPMYKLSPANASRFVTPQKRGFGFSYSTYGTPTSPSSVASTPGGLGQSLLMGSINRGLSKSISTSNLRRSLNVEDSILQPGAFSASSGPRLLGSAGSQKKLIISREMRSDLFATAPPKKDGLAQDASVPRKLTKRVSFDTHPNGNGVQESPAQTPEARPNQAEDLGYLRPVSDSPNGVNGSKPATPTAPEMEQVKGNELAVVHEEEHVAPPAIETVEPSGDKSPGTYWMSPSRDEIVAMNRVQRQKVADFTVGRENIGSVRFKVPVDLTNIDVDDLFDTIVILEPRSATVYPIAAKKPPVGKGLNVPAIISLEQSWPRGRDKKTTLKDKSGPRLQKHMERLKAIKNTTFIDYDTDKGVWTFSVEHFTTYGLDDDEDETDGELADTPRVVSQPTGQYEAASPDVASPETDPDDTFDFKRTRRAVPGAFDQSALSDDEAADEFPLQLVNSGPVVEPEPDYNTQGAIEDDTMEVEEAFQHAVIEQPSPRSVEEQEEGFAVSQAIETDPQVPAGIMRARMRAVKKSMAPTRIEVAGGNDWMQILQESVRAPRTTDRAALRALNESGAAWDIKERGSPAPQSRQVSDGTGFATSIDLMKSLFDQSKGPAQPAQALPAKGFVKWPYQRRSKVDEHDGDVPAARPKWGPNGTLVTATEEGFAVIPACEQTASTDLEKLARLQQYIDGTKVAAAGSKPQSPSLRQLSQGDVVWDLAAILFEDDGANLVAFWEQLIAKATDESVAAASSFEEKAIACLSGNRVLDACENLLAGGNFRLATLVSTIGTQTKDLRAQLNDWKESNVLSEFSEPVRAIYELLAGNACTCAGIKGVSMENRVSSFVISQRFNLDWKQSFALRLFYTPTASSISEAVRSFQADIEQDREPEPDSPLWFLLKTFASGKFDWSVNSLDWLLSKAIFSTGKLDFGLDAAERLDQISVAFASALTAQKHWVPASYTLIHLSDPAAREVAIRDHLGRHAHLIGSPKTPGSPFSSMRSFGVPDTWLWEARALHFRSKQDAQQEFLALMWAKNFLEANRTFLDRLAPELVIRRDYRRLYTLAELLYKVKDHLPNWDTGALAYLVYPMIRTQDRQQPLERWDERLFDGLVALRATTHGDIRQEAAIADMAEDLLQRRGGDHRLLQLLPEDVKARHLRNRALAV